MNWFLFWLFLHVLAAVIAFGPIFVFPLVGTLAAQMPQHLRFATELNHRIEMRLVLPVALSMLISGSGLIWTANIDFFHSGYLIVSHKLGQLLGADLAVAFAVLLPTTAKLVHIAEQMPAGAPTGPPPAELMTLIRRNQMFGGVTTVLFLVIIFLMIIEPGGLVAR